MNPATLELMHDQVCAIYRALTGTDLIVPEAPPAPEGEARVEDEELNRRFADLEALARRIPSVGERVPPFSFTPPIDVLQEPEALLIEVALPGVERGDVSVERRDGALEVTGVRRGERAANGRTYAHAEIPRGPFRRVIPLPEGVGSGAPEVKVAHGMVSIRLAKAPAEPTSSSPAASRSPAPSED
jgi:HSP20 family molecular chaperone IbpA